MYELKLDTLTYVKDYINYLPGDYNIRIFGYYYTNEYAVVLYNNCSLVLEYIIKYDWTKESYIFIATNKETGNTRQKTIKPLHNNVFLGNMLGYTMINILKRVRGGAIHE